MACRKNLLPAFTPLRAPLQKICFLSASHSFKTTISHRFTDHVGAAPQSLAEESLTTIHPSLFRRLKIRPSLLLDRSRSRSKSESKTRLSARESPPPSPAGSPHPADEDVTGSPNVFVPQESFNTMNPSSLTVTPPAPPSKRQRSRDGRPIFSRASSTYREVDDGPPPSPGLRIPAFLNHTKAGGSCPLTSKAGTPVDQRYF